MQISAKLSHLRIAPRKVRLVADLIRRKKVDEAEALLNFTANKSSLPILKLLKQAIANAKNNFQLDPINLYISKILVNEGPKLKRWRPRARGQASAIQKKTSQIVLFLEEIKPSAKKTKKKMKTTGLKAEKIIEPEKITEEKEKGKEIKVSEKPKFRPETKIIKPKTEKGFKKFFKRTVF